MMTHDPKTRARRGVLICGAYGLENAGDDAVLSAIVAGMRKQEADIPITVMARRPGQTARRFGIGAVHPLNILRWLPLMRRTALFISGGGSLLQDITSRRSLFYYLSVIRLARRQGCAVQLYGCGIGPLIRPGSREKTARVLNECADAITLRDGESAHLLADLGVRSPRILLAADPALSLPSAAGGRTRTVGFALRDWPGLRARMDDIAACAAYIWETYRLTPVLLCLAPEDRTPARELSARLAERGVPCSLTRDASRLGNMSLLLSMRLHGLVFALRDGVPAAGIIYDPKVAAFCREAGLPSVSLEDGDADALRRLADAAAELDREALSRSAAELRRREQVSAQTAAELLQASVGRV